jgi:AcrR family transcriptional regulator
MPATETTTQRLLDGALEAIGRFGITRFTMEDVGRTAGMARQTVYRYFPTRSALIDGVIQHQEARLLEGVRAEFAAADTLADALRAGVALTVGLLRSNSVLTGLLAREPGAIVPYLTTDAADSIERTGAAVQQLLTSRVDDRIPRHTLESAGDAFVRLIVSYVLAPRDLSDRQIADRVTAVILPSLLID